LAAIERAEAEAKSENPTVVNSDLPAEPVS
jgi:hypothetical protein